MSAISPNLHPRRTRPPPYAPHSGIGRLRESGWTLAQIAESIGASMREVSRWAAGDRRPLGVYEAQITRLLASSAA